MTLHLFLTEPGALEVPVGATVTLAGAEARHAAGSMRLGPGERVLLADGAGARVTAQILEAETGSGARVSLRVLEHRPERIETPRLGLVQALAKGDRDVLAVQTATELGVHTVIPWESERAIVRWRGPKEQRARQKWADALSAAAKQARRGVVPELGPTVSGLEVASLVTQDTLVVVLHEDAEEELFDLPATTWASAAHVLIVVGPEGGITPHELAALREAGARTVRFGEHILRSSTAGPAALAVLRHRVRASAHTPGID
ncbi:MAG: 16S rRNA (uracil(1498)-N(3))-methyltransferase [Micrococcus sp.]|nr:16S rRNA (uracil(1498)-N(3))-methyltransferase [Micrococcus sp.]